MTLGAVPRVANKIEVGPIVPVQTVVERYQTTTHVPEALHRLTESYVALGMTTEAQATAAVLGYNFPGSEWYERAYALVNGKPPPQSNSWFSSLF